MFGFRSSVNTLSGGSTFDMVGGRGGLWGTITLRGDQFFTSGFIIRGSQGEINSQVYCTYVFRYISRLKCITRANQAELSLSCAEFSSCSLQAFLNSASFKISHFNLKQAGAELCQAQVKLGKLASSLPETFLTS